MLQKCFILDYYMKESAFNTSNYLLENTFLTITNIHLGLHVTSRGCNRNTMKGFVESLDGSVLPRITNNIHSFV